MTINKVKDSKCTYYEIEVSKGTHLIAFSKRRLIIDLFNIYSISLFNQLNLN